MANNRYDGIDKYACYLIRYKAVQLVGNNGFVEDDRPDLEQEMMIDLLRGLARFDPQKSKKTTFIHRLVEQCIVNLIKANIAKCRDWRQCRVSLNTIIRQQNPIKIELIDRLDNDGRITNHTQESREQRVKEFRIDLHQTIDQMPTLLRDLFHLCCVYEMAELARKLNIPRITLHDRFNKVKVTLRASGMADYFSQNDDLHTGELS